MYQEYPPCPSLAPYIDKYWEVKGETEYDMRYKILPDGCADFIFSIQEPSQPLNGEMLMQPYRFYFVGPMRVYSELVTRSTNLHMMGVRFSPCGLAAFTKVPLGEFTDMRIDASELDMLFDNSFAEMLCERESLQERIQIIERFLLSRLSAIIPIDRQMLQATDLIIRSNGMLPIRQLTDKLYLGQRHFERKFKHVTGYTPKEFSRIIKFRNATRVLRGIKDTDMQQLAIDCGYYDQSHFIKEFRRLSGSNPSAFMSLPIPEDDPLTYI
ncbi:AraC family transcriptional regulator [Parabacteroides sp. TM07-1AC]|uniref:AraC family transcriptional regulator n=1 Tax=unclassified Parabacteroides TaxID=2649774 RepID=UPI000F0068D3|nr:AraC family transcriptional regulator [Parabacteroides sp. TM07-1AC]RHU27301.1 AraC family transcriptional regulator [Parabacteroides sp. TM07-1AC]